MSSPAVTNRPFPTQARVVVVGGGIVGCATAYHLARAGWTDVVLLERGELTCGSTFHAAGLVGQLRSNASITRLLGESVALYAEIEAETGQATGWKRCGGLRLACTEPRMEELRRQATTARSFGLEMHLLSPAEAGAMWPLIDTSDVLGAAFLPTDGSANPSDITRALAKGAKLHGATLIEGCPVTGVEVVGGRVRGVRTERGAIACEVVVNCCGQWAREFGQMAGVNVPLVSVEHQFMITEPIEGITPDLPTLRDPDRLTYYKEEVGGLVMGGYEPDPIPWAIGGIPKGFQYKLLPSNFEHFEQLAALAFRRLPALEHAGVRQLLNGPESFTPDGNFILGEAPEVAGYFVGAGFNAFGIAAAGGAGWALAAWIMQGEPPYDLWPVDIRRFGLPHRDIGWVRTRTLEMYGKHYTLSWPHEEHDSGRPLRRSPLYDRLAARGACFGEKLGWERPNWFAPPGVEARDVYSFGRQNWFPHVAAEHRAVRSAAGLFDQSSFAKFLVVGNDAARALSWLCANRVDREIGALTYTQLCNSRGGIECDLTVARLASDRFYLTTGTGFATHDLHWIRTQMPTGLDAHVLDVTSAWAVLCVHGPRARDILTPLCPEDLSNRAFPFGTWRDIQVAGAPVRALRVTYVGELGWELHVPVEFAQGLYDALMDAGAPLGLVDAGYRAIESLRLEKGYRAWGKDLTPGYSPLEAGLGWAVKLKTDVDFLGRTALLAQRAGGIKRRLVTLSVADDQAVLFGQETILRDGQPVGWLTSAGHGHTVGRGIGLGYVRCDQGVDAAFLREGNWQLEVAGRPVAAELHTRPLFDPTHARVKS